MRTRTRLLCYLLGFAPVLYIVWSIVCLAIRAVPTQG